MFDTIDADADAAVTPPRLIYRRHALIFFITLMALPPFAVLCADIYAHCCHDA